MLEEIDFTERAKEILTGFDVPIWDGTVGMMVAELKGIYEVGQRAMRERAAEAGTRITPG